MVDRFLILPTEQSDLQVPLYIVAQLAGSALATFVGSTIYGVETNLMTTRPIHGSSSAFWVEFIATFIIVLLAASMTYNHQTVRRKHVFFTAVRHGSETQQIISQRHLYRRKKADFPFFQLLLHVIWSK